MAPVATSPKIVYLQSVDITGYLSSPFVIDLFEGDLGFASCVVG